MQRRHIVITAGAAVAAFAVAFGIGKAAGGEEAATAVPPGEPAAAFDVPSAAITADVETEALPALKPKPTPEPEEPEPAATSTPAPSATTQPFTPTPAPTTAPDEGPVTGGGED